MANFAKTKYLEQKILNHVLLGEEYTPSSQLYFALLPLTREEMEVRQARYQTQTMQGNRLHLLQQMMTQSLVPIAKILLSFNSPRPPRIGGMLAMAELWTH